MPIHNPSVAHPHHPPPITYLHPPPSPHSPGGVRHRDAGRRREHARARHRHLHALQEARQDGGEADALAAPADGGARGPPREGHAGSCGADALALGGRARRLRLVMCPGRRHPLPLPQLLRHGGEHPADARPGQLPRAGGAELRKLPQSVRAGAGAGGGRGAPRGAQGAAGRGGPGGVKDVRGDAGEARQGALRWLWVCWGWVWCGFRGGCARNQSW